MAINTAIDDIMHIDESMCRGCTSCARNCPVGAIISAPKTPHRIDPAKCVNCGYCVNVCGFHGIKVKDSKEDFKALLADPNKKVAIQFAPSVRVGLGEMFGMEPGVDVTGKLVTALKKMGVDYVYDTNVSADLTILEEANEFLNRLQNGGVLPLFTSCCPSWDRYVEKYAPDFLDNISSCRSPMQMQSPVIKEYHRVHKNEEVTVCAVMPCTAKKYEAKRDEFKDPIDGKAQTELVLTVVEMGQLIEEAGYDFPNLPDTPADDPFGYGTGGAVIFGVTGGVAEAVVRYVANEKLHVPIKETVELSSSCGIRGYEKVREASVMVGDIQVNIAVVNGLKNVGEVLDKVRSGEANYHIIEVMTCPNGCVGGGGMPKAKDKVKQQRGQGLYNADDSYALKASNENPAMDYIYNEVVKDKVHELLHVNYEH